MGRGKTPVKLIVLFLAVSLLITNLAVFEREGMTVCAQTLPGNPLVQEDVSMTAGQKVTWDCIKFGFYPQTEIVDSANTCGTYQEGYGSDSDYIVDASLYEMLNAASETEWDVQGDIEIDGVRYKRVKSSDATISTSDNYHYDWDGHDHSGGYHYFRYEPIRWRVLKINGSQALLLADRILDNRLFHTESDSAVSWQTCTIRSWLNGYDGTENSAGADYSSNSFISTAFDASGQAAIVTTVVGNESTGPYSASLGGGDTNDKIFLLSSYDLYGSAISAEYGFYPDDYQSDEARRSRSTTFAKAMGTFADQGETSLPGNGFWWLRSPGADAKYAANVDYDGSVNYYGNQAAVQLDYGIRPALTLDLTDTGVWDNDGTVCSDDQSTYTEPTPEPVEEEAIKVVSKNESHYLIVGKKLQLKVETEGVKIIHINWISSNDKYATVDSNGVVTTKKAGKGKSITITAEISYEMLDGDDGSQYSGTPGVDAAIYHTKRYYKITIPKDKIKKITISGKTSVKAGKSIKLKARTTPKNVASGRLSWRSGNTSYATVSGSGKVKAKKTAKKKKVTITCSANDGSGKKKSVKISIK